MEGGGIDYKLIGILIADVKDYCPLLGAIEETTVQDFKACRSSFNYLSQQYHERIVDSP